MSTCTSMEMASAVVDHLKERGMYVDWIQVHPDGDRLDLVLMKNMNYSREDDQRHFAICVFDGLKLTSDAPEWLRCSVVKEHIWCRWSDFDGIHYGSKEDLIASGAASEGDTIYIGDKIPYNGPKDIDSTSIIALIREQIGNDDVSNELGGHSPDDWDYSDSAKEELDNFMDAWMKKHNPTGFYTIDNEKPYTVTAEDMNNA
ncbi:hypothetical protein ACVAPW_000879 [Shigella sonnei]